MEITELILIDHAINWLIATVLLPNNMNNIACFLM